MNKKIMTIFISSIFIVTFFTTISVSSLNISTNQITIQVENQPPSSPVIIGPTLGKVGKNYEYSFMSIDSDGDYVYFLIYWDGDFTRPHDNIGPFKSGEEAKAYYKFPEEKDYIIAAMARNSHGKVNLNWGTLPIKIPKTNLLTKNDNNPPGQPRKLYISERDSLLFRNKLYEFNTQYFDPDGDRIKYGLDWDGDGIVDEWDDDNGKYYAYTGMDTVHRFTNSGVFQVKVKACDEHGLEGEWSNPLNVTVCINCLPEVKEFKGNPIVSKGREAPEGYFLNVWDPENEQIFCYFDWDDGTNTGWIEGRNANHIWNKVGTYTIKAKAKDIFNAETGWYYFSLKVVRFRAISYNLFENSPILLKIIEIFFNYRLS